MNITEATREGDAESNMMADRDEEYNTRYGGYKGALDAFARTKLVPRRPASVSLTKLVADASAGTADEVVNHFIGRFLSVPPAEEDRRAIVEFLTKRMGSPSLRQGPQLEGALRETLYLVLSTPEYQLG
jgi:hypothetical protein